MSHPQGADIDTDGSAVIVDSNNHRVMRWAVGSWTGEVVAGGNGNGNGLHQLNHPTAVHIYKGAYYIADGNNNRIVKWTKGATIGAVVSLV